MKLYLVGFDSKKVRFHLFNDKNKKIKSFVVENDDCGSLNLTTFKNNHFDGYGFHDSVHDGYLCVQFSYTLPDEHHMPISTVPFIGFFYQITQEQEKRAYAYSEEGVWVFSPTLEQLLRGWELPPLKKF